MGVQVVQQMRQQRRQLAGCTGDEARLLFHNVLKPQARLKSKKKQYLDKYDK